MGAATESPRGSPTAAALSSWRACPPDCPHLWPLALRILVILSTCLAQKNMAERIPVCIDPVFRRQEESLALARRALWPQVCMREGAGGWEMPFLPEVAMP